MDIKSYILKLLVLPKSATFVVFALVFGACSSEISAAMFQSPPGIVISTSTFQSPPGI